MTKIKGVVLVITLALCTTLVVGCGTLSKTSVQTDVNVNNQKMIYGPPIPNKDGSFTFPKVAKGS